MKSGSYFRPVPKALEKRYGIQFPHLVRPAQVGLGPFLFSKGYYVFLLNSSGDDMTHVEIRYRSRNGGTVIQHQSVANRLEFGPTILATKVDPSRIGWTVGAGEWITIVYDGGRYSYPTSKLIPK